MRGLLLVAMLWNCGGQTIPDHLRVDGQAAATSRLPPTSASEAVTQLVAHDPFVRRTVVHPAEHWSGAGAAAPGLMAWSALVARGEPQPQALRAIGTTHGGTPVVAVARGRRLRQLEDTLRTGTGEAAQVQLALLWGPIDPAPNASAPPARSPLAWLHSDNAVEDLLYVAERAVLLGWLDGPEIPAAPVSAALVDGRHDRWIDSPAGRIIRARAANTRSPESSARGRAALRLAADLALEEAAADRDSEQKAMALSRDQARADRELEETEDVVAVLLSEARLALTEDAGDPDSAGLALVALQAERLRGTCPDLPCGGLDIDGSLAGARLWSDAAHAEADVWRLISAKQTLDRFEVAHDRPGADRLIDLIADLWIGEHDAHPTLATLQARSFTPAVVLDLTRAAGHPGATETDVLMSLLRELVAQRAGAVADRAEGPRAQRAARTRDRAAKP